MNGVLAALPAKSSALKVLDLVIHIVERKIALSADHSTAILQVLNAQ